MPGAIGSGPKAIVIGAGLAGLAAAYRLSGGGWDVEVLEKSRGVGGRCSTVPEQGFLFDTGAQYCRDSYDSTLKTAIELALGERFRVPAERPGVYLDGRTHPFIPRSANPAGLLPWKALGARSLRDVGRVAAPLVSGYRSYNLRFPEWWLRADRESAAGALRGVVSRKFARGFMEPAAEFALGAGLSDLSAAGMFVALRMLLADRTLSFTTGIGSVGEALASRLEVRTGAAVTGVAVRGGRAVGVFGEVDGRGIEEGADLVVSAVPAAEALALCPELEGALRPVLDGVPRSDALVVNVACERDPEGTAGPVLLPAGERFSASWACTSRSKALEYAPTGACVLTVVFAGRRASALLSEPDGKLLEAALSDAARLYPAGGLQPKAFRVDRHPAGWPVVVPGYSAAVRRLAREGSGIDNLLLAGDWTASPTMEGAVMSGFNAAERAALLADALH